MSEALKNQDQLCMWSGWQIQEKKKNFIRNPTICTEADSLSLNFNYWLLYQ